MSPSEPRLKIVIEQGPSAGAELVLAEGTFLIGRDPAADLPMSGDETVSKRHAEVVCTDSGVVLKNLSPNGTLINGRPVLTAPLSAGDSISVGLLSLLRVRAYVKPAPPPPPPTRRPAATGDTDKTVLGWTPGGEPAADQAPPAAARRMRLPVWLVAYLALMAIAFIGFGIMRLRAPGAPGLPEIQAQEQAYASSRKLAEDETARVLRLLETAAVHERRGDERSAYEAYRETLGARHPVVPESPAYRYAAFRMAVLGPE